MPARWTTPFGWNHTDGPCRRDSDSPGLPAIRHSITRSPAHCEVPGGHGSTESIDGSGTIGTYASSGVSARSSAVGHGGSATSALDIASP